MLLLGSGQKPRGEALGWYEVRGEPRGGGVEIRG